MDEKISNKSININPFILYRITGETSTSNSYI